MPFPVRLAAGAGAERPRSHMPVPRLSYKMNDPDGSCAAMSNNLFVTLGIALAYALGAKIGFLFQIPLWHVPLVWPPPAIALTATLLLGSRALPGIFLGAVIANLLVIPSLRPPSLITVASAQPVVMLGIMIAQATGAMLVALIAGRVLRRISSKAPIWGSAREILLGTLAIGLVCILYAVIGTTSLRLSGLLPVHMSVVTGGLWWLITFFGMTIFTPLFYMSVKYLFFRSEWPQYAPRLRPVVFSSSFSAATLATFLLLWNSDTDAITKHLDAEAKIATDNVGIVLHNAQRDLEDIRALFYASDYVTPELFQRFLAANTADASDRPVARSKGWVARVTDPAAWEEKMRRTTPGVVSLFEVGVSGAPEPVGKRDEYFPLELIDPLNELTRQAIGFDIGTEESRLAALEFARDTGQVGMTAPILLSFTELQDPAMQLCLAVYRPDTPLETVAARRANLTGFACGAYLIKRVFGDAMVAVNADIELRLFDLSPAGVIRLHQAGVTTAQTNPQSWSAAAKLEDLRRRPNGTARLSFGGHNWLVMASPRAGYVAAMRSWTPWGTMVLLLALGTTISSIMIERANARRRVGEERRKTERALVEAQEANAAKSYFMAAASHDIKQPLVALGILTDKALLDNSHAATEQLVRRLRDGINEMSAHFDTLMDLERFRSGTFAVSQATFKLGGFASRIDLEIAPLCAEKDLEWHLDMDNVAVRTDQELLLRLFRNLLSNAVQNTVHGEVRCVASAHGAYVEFLIADTGPGLPEQQRQTLLDALENIAPTRLTGSGLGLSIVGKIARALDLDLRMSSTAGAGTRFWFRLRLAAAA
ncbi:MAG: CHASE domain-containing protein [Halioglobus sp.]